MTCSTGRGTRRCAPPSVATGPLSSEQPIEDLAGAELREAGLDHHEVQVLLAVEVGPEADPLVPQLLADDHLVHPAADEVVLPWADLELVPALGDLEQPGQGRGQGGVRAQGR